MDVQEMTRRITTNGAEPGVKVHRGQRPVRGSASDRNQPQGDSVVEALVDADLKKSFRDAMAGVATPVSVVTTIGGDGSPHGTTVSAFASLSMEPPMVLVSLDRNSELLRKLREAERFGLNLLAYDQSDIALKFATKDALKFEGVIWNVEDGAPRLGGSAGWVSCSIDSLVDGGDHVVVLGLVDAAASDGTAPLTYHARRFGTHAEHRTD